MGLISDLVSILPNSLKLVFGIFLITNFGVTILNVLVFVWNIFIAAVNVANGCASNAAACVPYAEGIIVFGINIADYWVINALVFFPILALFAIKWYGTVFQNANA